MYDGLGENCPDSNRSNRTDAVCFNVTAVSGRYLSITGIDIGVGISFGCLDVY